LHGSSAPISQRPIQQNNTTNFRHLRARYNISKSALPKSAAHEQFDRLPPAHTLSGRMFGLSLTLALTVLGFSPVRHGHTPRWWAIDAAALFLAVALCRPSLLGPLAEVWAKLLRPVNAVVTWVTMGLLFGLVIVPAGLGRRFVVRDPLQLRKDPQVPSYWKPRSPSDAVRESMVNQF
jgi:hypothetical protein